MTLNGMMKPGYQRSVICTSPAAPVAGNAVRCGLLTGVSITDESKEGNATGYTSVDFGPRSDMFSVTASAGAIAQYDAIYLADGAPTVLSNDSTGYFFGIAMTAIASGTATIEVQHIPSPGAGTLGAGTVGATNLASNSVIAAKIATGAVTHTKLAGGFLKVAVIDGAAAGDHTVTGIAVGDELIAVLHLSTKAAIATMDNLTSEFTVAAGKITNALGTDTTDDQLLVMYLDLTA
jgi:hypothetical protein